MSDHGTREAWRDGCRCPKCRMVPLRERGGFEFSDFPTYREREWITDALCAQTDPAVFFPEKGASTREAKAVCRRCPVAAECLEDALSRGERSGVWGGLSERERRNLMRGAA